MTAENTLDQRSVRPSLPPVLLFSSSDWNGLWGSRQQVALELNRRGYRVLFIEQFAGLQHLYRYPDTRQRRLKGQRLIEQAKGLWCAMPPPLLPGHYYSPTVSRLNAKFARWRLRSIIQEFLQGQRPILWMFKPEHHFVIGCYDEICSVYHCIDEYTVGTSGRKKAVIASLEKNILEKADAVFANSLITWENKKKIAPQALRFPSGANVEHFAQTQNATPHPQVIHSPKPVLMYAGSINEKIDIQLLIHLAKAQPNWSIVLIGQIYLGVDLDSINQLKILPNVQFVGNQPFDQLPNWFAAADVCLLPYVAGEATLYRSPLKLYEYLATGRPIISTFHPEVDELADFVAIAQPEDWVDTLKSILMKETDIKQKERLVEAKKHSWQVRVDGMLEAIQPFILKERC
jgi:glycosyltransferase involved in cell wall biosynthesis